VARPWRSSTRTTTRTRRRIWRHTAAASAAGRTKATGVYDSYGAPGWTVFGGTSVSAPIIASVYALAGNAYDDTGEPLPYLTRGSLYDVTSGRNGSCSGTYLCTAGRGYDGPTGLGTPVGTSAF
jgi:subtilase family serine protease